MSRQEAYDYVKSRRSIANPNEGFWKQLETYEGILKARYFKECHYFRIMMWSKCTLSMSWWVELG